MKIKSIWFIVLFLLCMAPMSQAQSYDQLWKEVEKAQQADRPQTAISITEKIYRKAEAEKNSGQMLKAYTSRAQYRQIISPDSFYVDLSALEKWATTTTIHEDCAVLHTLLAQIYADYTQNNGYSLRRRTDVSDAPSDDIREWSGNMFAKKVLDHTRAALEDPDPLFRASAKEYVPFVVIEKGSDYYQHNLYHLLASYGVTSLRTVARVTNDSLIGKNIAGIYGTLNRKYKEQNNTDALLLVGLDELKWRRSNERMTSEEFIGALDALIQSYADRDISVEAHLAKARELKNRNRKVEALQVCDDAIAQYPKYARINAIKELRQNIRKPSFRVDMPADVYPGDTISLKVSHANINSFTVQLYKIDLPGSHSLRYSFNQEETIKKHGRKVLTKSFSVIPPEDYLPQDTLFTLKAPYEGFYLMEIKPNAPGGERRFSQLTVTRLKLLSRTLPDKRFEVVALDAKTGQPVQGATVDLFINNRGAVKTGLTLKTGSNGRAETDWNKEYQYISVVKGADNGFVPQWLRREGFQFVEEKKAERIALLTDRSLYRPGQTIYVKGIAYSHAPDTARVIAGKEFTVSLFDANNREVHKKALRTNDFGSFTTDFMIPAGGLNGMYSIRVNSTQTAIRVEEYKRPTFEVTLNKPEGTYKLGDSLTLKGSAKSYSGVPVQEVPVQYVVTRNVIGWWGPFYTPEETIDSGTAQLDENGEFTLSVKLTPADDKITELGYYAYKVTATVTNVAGESQLTTAMLYAGNRSLLLSSDIPDMLNRDENIRVTFNARNLSGQPISVTGQYKLYRFTNTKTGETAAHPALTGTFTSNTETMLPGWKALPSGTYKLVLTAKDEQGREATFETQTVLFSLSDKRPAKREGIWYYGIQTEFDANQPAEFLFGVPDKDAYVLMDVFSGKQRLESHSILLSDSVTRFTYPYKESYGDGLAITFCYVKNNETYTRQVILKKKMPAKELKLSWNVFRDKLRPGQEEEWRLTIHNPDSTFAQAELMATLYDASLDQIWKRDQRLSVPYHRRVPSASWNIYRVMNVPQYYWFRDKSLTYPELLFDHFWDGNYLVLTAVEASGAANGSLRIRGKAAYPMLAESVVVGSTRAVADMAYEEEVADDADVSLPEATPDLRTNFAETAFFYPQLRTNEKGEVVIAFTMPESLTRWNFSGYAHTQGMLTGMITGQTVTGKEFMLTPNLPRFVRVGDHTVVAASVANLTEQDINGNVVLTLFDPLTEKVIDVRRQKFNAVAGKTVAVNFAFTATDKYNLLGCRIVAEGGTFSDGEQHLLPVLSNKEQVIETVPMPVRGNQTKEFAMRHLFNNNSATATNRSLTVEFSGNPAWYAVQALPALSLPTNDNTVSWATAYYANTLAAHIMNSQPRIKAIFDAWKQQGGNKETFLSNLQKNQDVKGILLEESPWVMEATTEQEQKERLATLFDLNNIRNNNITALNKLKDLQLVSGAWTWYKGMTGSRYITNYVMQQLYRLAQMTGTPLDGEVAAMCQRGFSYLHAEALTEYKAIRKAEQQGSKITGLSDNTLQYLYLIALSGEKVPDANKTAYTYFLNKAKGNIASKGLTEKALSAIILQKAGQKADVNALITSLKEYTTQTDEQGMFFAFNEDFYSWQNLKVPAHVTVMEAFDVVGGYSDEVEEMKLWLLKEKQTQQWNSPVATANAVYALLYRGTSPVQNQGDVRVSIGNKVMETLSPMQQGTPGIAYIKEVFTDKSDLAKMKKAVVEKRDAGIAWGAVYARYEEELDKVTSYGQGLQVEKKLYIEKVTGGKKELVPITTGSPLKVGDKVVSRVTIKLDRAMDFVQLKDQRSACFEPIYNLSGYTWGAGTGYYVAVKDASTNFYFDALSKGVYVLEHSYRVSRTGTYESGLATIQSAYAPEYASHAQSIKLKIEN